MNVRLKQLSILCVAVLLIVTPVPAQETRPRLYRVDASVYRGPQPHKRDIPVLAKQGFRTVLDVRGTLDHKRWERGAVEAAGMRYIRIGLSPFFPPSRKKMDRILAVLEDPTLAPIYVHCRRGADRAGLVIACYRIAHDHWTNAQAMQEAREQGIWWIEILMKRYIEHYHAESASPQTGSR